MKNLNTRAMKTTINIHYNNETMFEKMQLNVIRLIHKNTVTVALFMRIRNKDTNVLIHLAIM